jgi:peptidyl-prolyl cis-trans isomerase C
VQTQFGWHVIRLEDTRDVTPPPFDQVKSQLTNAVIRKKLQAYVDQLKKDAKIEKKM